MMMGRTRLVHRWCATCGLLGCTVDHGKATVVNPHRQVEPVIAGGIGCAGCACGWKSHWMRLPVNRRQAEAALDGEWTRHAYRIGG